jgi:hypothetical protein
MSNFFCKSDGFIKIFYKNYNVEQGFNLFMLYLRRYGSENQEKKSQSDPG